MVGKSAPVGENLGTQLKTNSEKLILQGAIEVIKETKTLVDSPKITEPKVHANVTVNPKIEKSGLKISNTSSKEEITQQRICPAKIKVPSNKKGIRQGDERCKYCRRLLYQSSAIRTGSSTNRSSGSSGSARSVSVRRPFKNTLDEVAWACGRLWCSVRRRKKRRILAIHHQRKKVKIDEAFSTLREILPPAAQPEVNDDSEASKVSTLRLASSYIQALSDLLKDTHLSDKHARSQTTTLTHSKIIKDSKKIDPNNAQEFLLVSQSEDKRSIVNKLPTTGTV